MQYKFLIYLIVEGFDNYVSFTKKDDKRDFAELLDKVVGINIIKKLNK